MDGILSEAIGMGIDKLTKREPKTSIKMPSISDLEESFNRIYGATATATEPPPAEPAEDKISKGTACIPCTLSHSATCAGELAEAVRFVRGGKELNDEEVVKRIDHCIGEIAAAERIDLAPENTEKLPPGEKEIALDAARQLRDIRHGLEWFKTADDLEKLAAQMSNLQHDINRAWLTQRLKNLTPEQKEQVKARAQQLIEQKLK